MTAKRTIGILLFENVEELDAVGPWEVLTYWTRNHPDDGFDVMTFADSLAPVTCAKGLRILPDTTTQEIPDLEVMVYPGGQGTRPRLSDMPHLTWVREQRSRVPLMTSVCTGSLVYAAAGLLRNRPATTHWGSLDLLAELDPTIEIRRDDRFVEDDLPAGAKTCHRGAWKPYMRPPAVMQGFFAWPLHGIGE